MSKKNVNPKILFVWTKNAGVAWYRVIQFAAAIAKVGKMELGKDVFYPPWNPANELGHQWEYEMQGSLKTATKFFAPLISKADVVVFQTVATQIGYALFLSCKDLQKKVLTTIDDVESNVPYTHEAFVGNQPGAIADSWIKLQLQNSDAVITSTNYLKEKLSPLNPKTFVVPNAINFELWDKVKRPKSDGSVKFGWAGGFGHEADLEIIEEPCKKIREKYGDKVQFWFVGGPPPWAKDLEGFHCRSGLNGGWAQIDKYHHFLGSFGFDVGLAPLRDNEFNRGKSNLRWLEYSALKIPTIASDVESFKNTPTHWVCQNEKDWMIVMEGCIDDPNERKTFGIHAYEACKRFWNINLIAKDFLNILKGVYHDEPVISQVNGERCHPTV